MARVARSAIAFFFRQNPLRTCQNPSTQIRCLSVESKETEFKREGTKASENVEDPRSENQDFVEIAKDVSEITKRRRGWEKSLLSDFPSFNFADPQFFTEFLKHQENVFCSLRFLPWLRQRYSFIIDEASGNELFESLLERKAWNATKFFLDLSGFIPKESSRVRYIRSLCKRRLVQDAIDLLMKWKGAEVCLSIETWNSALFGCIKVERTDLFWKLYHDMLESGLAADVNVKTVEYLIQAFCIDGNFTEGYELLRQVLNDGLDPGNSVYNKLISGFCTNGNYPRVSQLLHMMIARKHLPDICTYQQIISGLCKRKMQIEALRIFNDLKDRGYVLDVFIYSTMIHGLACVGMIDDANNLWSEMINKAIRPNDYTYIALIYGFCKVGNFEQARRFYKEMCDQGYRETTQSYNVMIKGLCFHGRIDEAFELFKEMPQKGIVCDLDSYNIMIYGCCKEGRLADGQNLLKQLLAQGLKPSILSYTSLIEKLCKTGDVQVARHLWDDMLNRGLEPRDRTFDYFIVAWCAKGCVTEVVEWLVAMVNKKLKPKWETCEAVVQCIVQSNQFKDSLHVLSLIMKTGYVVQ